MPKSTPSCLVSVHGGHSGQFCSHAKDALADIVATYRERGFAWVGITEPMASGARAIVPAEEAEAGLDLEGIRARFADYFATARGLQRDFADTMPILLAFEAESYAGYEAAVADFIAEHRPDYIVGSVHHVDDPSCRRPAHAASPPLRATTHTGLRVWGNYISAGVRLLEELGFDTCWPVPGSGWSSG